MIVDGSTDARKLTTKGENLEICFQRFNARSVRFTITLGRAIILWTTSGRMYLPTYSMYVCMYGCFKLRAISMYSSSVTDEAPRTTNCCECLYGRELFVRLSILLSSCLSLTSPPSSPSPSSSGRAPSIVSYRLQQRTANTTRDVVSARLAVPVPVY